MTFLIIFGAGMVVFGLAEVVVGLRWRHHLRTAEAVAKEALPLGRFPMVTAGLYVTFLGLIVAALGIWWL